MTIADPAGNATNGAPNASQADEPEVILPYSALSYGMSMLSPTALFVDWRLAKEQLKAASTATTNETAEWHIDSEHFSLLGMLWKIRVCSYVTRQGSANVRHNVACLLCDNPRSDVTLNGYLYVYLFDETANAWKKYDKIKSMQSHRSNHALLPNNHPASWKIYDLFRIPVGNMIKANDFFVSAQLKIAGEEIKVDASVPISLSANIMNACAKRMYERPELADVTIIASDGTRFECHRFALAITSPVFLTMMTCGMKESITSEISLPTTSPAVIAAFRKLAYGLDAKIDYDILDDLIEFGRQYDVEVVRHAITKLLAQYDSMCVSKLGHCLPTLLQPDVLEFLGVDNKDECMQVALSCAMTSLPAWLYDPWFLERDAAEFTAVLDTLSRVLPKLLRCAHRRIDPWMWFRFEFARRWICYDKNRRRKKVSALMKSIDFAKMTFPQLLNASETECVRGDIDTVIRIMTALSGCH